MPVSSEVIRHKIAYYDENTWAATPANNGGNGPIWQWDDELLVGFTVGAFKKAKSGHQCSYDVPFESWLARSVDGGESWIAWKPEEYAGGSHTSQTPPGNLNFTQTGFLMRVEGNGYHGNKGAQWFYSKNRGLAWNGPFHFGNLLCHPELAGKEFSARTAYTVINSHELYLFLTVRERPSGNEKRSGEDVALRVARREKSFMVRTADGGRTFSFVSWVVPWDDPYRAAMPAPVRTSPSKMVVAVRRKSVANNWIDCYHTTDNGRSWSFLSKVDYTELGEHYNGNPPGLILMEDGRLCCVYGNRSDECITARFSEDEGQGWGIRQVIRKGFQSLNGFPDLGYPRLFQRPDRKCVAIYFWCSPDRPQTHIAATIF